MQSNTNIQEKMLAAFCLFGATVKLVLVWEIILETKGQELYSFMISLCIYSYIETVFFGLNQRILGGLSHIKN